MKSEHTFTLHLNRWWILQNFESPRDSRRKTVSWSRSKCDKPLQPMTDNCTVFRLGAVQTGSECQNGAFNIISHTHRNDSLITIYKKTSNFLSCLKQRRWKFWGFHSRRPETLYSKIPLIRLACNRTSAEYRIPWIIRHVYWRTFL